MQRVADAAPAEDRAVLLEVHDALQVHRAGLDHDADDREHERQLVGDELRGGTQRAHQRELVRARPARHQHADDRQARHRERVEHADVERRDDEPRARRDHDEHEERRQHDDRGREREHAPVGLGRHDVFLLQELDAVADELVPAVEAAGVHRTEPALHVAHHLQQEDVAEDRARSAARCRARSRVLIASVVPQPTPDHRMRDDAVTGRCPRG